GVLGQRMVNGQPLNVWYLAKYEGIDPETGTSMYLGHDGSISSTNDPAVNKFYTNSPNPTTLLGLTANASYRQFTFSANFNGAMAHYLDRKSTRLNSSHVKISYAVFCLKKKKTF